jgi:hypothetical protein
MSYSEAGKALLLGFPAEKMYADAPELGQLGFT